jgi:hypothetical protein
MHVFGYLGADIRIILKWELQQPGQEMDTLESSTMGFSEYIM